MNSDTWTEIESSVVPHIELDLISTIHAKTESSSILTLKPIDFWPACKNQINFDHPQKNEGNQFAHQNQVIFGPHTKNQLSFDPDAKNETTFDQYIKIK